LLAIANPSPLCYSYERITNRSDNSARREQHRFEQEVTEQEKGIPIMAEAKDQGLKIRIRLKAYDHKVIDQSAKQIVDTALRTGANVAGPVPLPTRKSTYTVVKSPHVYKMGGEAFEMRVHKRLIDITNATPKTIDSLQNLSLPAGVDAEIRM